VKQIFTYISSLLKGNVTEEKRGYIFIRSASRLASEKFFVPERNIYYQIAQVINGFEKAEDAMGTEWAIKLTLESLFDEYKVPKNVYEAEVERRKMVMNKIRFTEEEVDPNKVGRQKIGNRNYYSAVHEWGRLVNKGVNETEAFFIIRENHDNFNSDRFLKMLCK
jgi:hypothetical protein